MYSWLTTLAGLRSRCTTPASCASCRALHSDPAMSSTSSTAQPPVEGDALQQARPVQVFHDQERTALRIDVVVEDADDVGVAELGGGATLAEEPLAQDASSGVLSDLDGDIVAEQDAPGAIDSAHAAAGEQLENLVSAVEHLAWREHADGISYDAT